MIRAPRIPPQYLPEPVSAEERALAQERTRSRGGRIAGGLAAWGGLQVLLTVLGMWAIWRALKLLGGPGGPAGMAEVLRAALPVWALPGIFLLMVIALGFQLWAVLLARRVILAAQAWALDPVSGPTHELRASVRAVRPWITLSQWAPIALSVLNLAALFFGLQAIGSLDELGDASPTSLAGGLPGIALTQLPNLILNWLILGSVGRWADALFTRTRELDFPVRPFGRSTANWLLFTLIFAVLQLLNLLVTVGGLLLLPQLMALGERADLGFAAPLIQIGGWALAPLVLLSALGIALLAWSRAFALDVATLLDGAGVAGKPGFVPVWASGQAQAVAADPWSAPEITVRPELGGRSETVERAWPDEPQEGAGTPPKA